MSHLEGKKLEKTVFFDAQMKNYHFIADFASRIKFYCSAMIACR
jgi:hypothetical protein